MATTWTFWNEKRISDVYENIYIRTHIEDWYLIVNEMARQINTTSGGQTKKILDRVTVDYVCDIVEPDTSSLEKARQFLAMENSLGKAWVGGVADLNQRDLYDVIYTSHTNYYWGISVEDYNSKLENLYNAIKLGGKLLILTLPEESAHYKVMLHQIYPTWNYSEHAITFYKSKGYDVYVKRFKMRIYVGDILENQKHYELSVFYKFIHNTTVFPDIKQLDIFRSKMKENAQDGYLDFADDLLVVSKPA